MTSASKKLLAERNPEMVTFEPFHQNDYKEITGIHYCTMVAMVEGSGATNNGYSVVELSPTGNIAVHGFRKQQDRNWHAAETGLADN